MTNHFAKSFVLVFLDWLFAFMDRLGLDFSFGLLFQFDSGYPMSSRDISHHFGTITVFSHTEVGRIYMYFQIIKSTREQSNVNPTLYGEMHSHVIYPRAE
jgi:hypothetical protein